MRTVGVGSSTVLISPVLCEENWKIGLGNKTIRSNDLDVTIRFNNKHIFLILEDHACTKQYSFM